MPRPKKDAVSDDTAIKESTYILQEKIYTKDGRIISEDEEKAVITVRKFVTATAEIGLQFGGTVNLGNFESARLDIICKIPTYLEEIDDAYNFAFKFADNKLNEQLKKLQTAANERNNKDLSPF